MGQPPTPPLCTPMNVLPGELMEKEEEQGGPGLRVRLRGEAQEVDNHLGLF